MDMYQALRSRLLTGDGMAALVSNRVDWDLRPAGKPLPAITLQVITDPDEQTYEGPQVLRSTLVQMDIWAIDRATTVAIKKTALPAILPAVRMDGIRFEQSFVNDSQDTTETATVSSIGTSTVFRTRVDLRVWSAPIT